jgi:HK97 family phage portal protein
MVISSYGKLQAMPRPASTWVTGPHSLNLYGPSMRTYGDIYRTQPNVRTCVDFLARNVAQLGVHVYRRASDVDRKRLADHPLAALLYAPNPGKTRYRFLEDLMADLGIYFNAYWLKVRGSKLGLVRLPPAEVCVEGCLLPTAFHWTPQNGDRQTFAPSEIVHFSGYSTRLENALEGVSPLETLRRILAEEAAAGDYRQNFWKNAARIEGVITRPKDAPKWTPAQQQHFREQWNEKFTGGSNSGKTPVLEDGMDLKPYSFSARDSEYVQGGKLRREVCAAAYHIPLPMVGILDHATFSNIKEQHKQLYQDSLGPWLEMIAEEFERQILPEFDDVQDIYVEFNIAEKLKGSFEEQAQALFQLVGAPIMTRNEGRARLNLPSSTDPDADELVLPLNMSGASTLPTAPAEPPDADPPAKPKPEPADAAATAAATGAIIRAAWIRQQARLDKVPAEERAATFNAQRARWDRELAADLLPAYSAAGLDDAEALRRSADLAALVNSETAELLASRRYLETVIHAA